MTPSNCERRPWCPLAMLVLTTVIPAANALAADVCEVRLIDTVPAREAFKKQQNPVVAMTVLGRFEPNIGEEELTTKHFGLPGTKEYIVASVYSTDDELALRRPGDDLRYDTSIRLGLAVADSKPEAAFGVNNNAVAVANTSDELLLVNDQRHTAGPSVCRRARLSP